MLESILPTSLVCWSAIADFHERKIKRGLETSRVIFPAI